MHNVYDLYFIAINDLIYWSENFRNILRELFYINDH